MKASRGVQSVLLALDTITGNLIEANELLNMDESMLRELRRATLSGIKRSGNYETEPRLRCGICEGPVHISMRKCAAKIGGLDD